MPVELPQEVRLECFGGGPHRPDIAQIRQPGHHEPGVPAGVDAAERLEIDAHVQGDAVICRTTAHADADARQLAALDVYAGSISAALGNYAELGSIIDDAALESGDDVANTESGTPQVDQRVDDELTGTVIGNLAATIDLHDRNVARSQYMITTRVHAQREDRRVLEEPDLIGSIRAALIGEALHGTPGRLVIDEAEVAKDMRRRRGATRCPGRLTGNAHRRRAIHEATTLCAQTTFFSDARRVLSSPALFRFRACSAR